jgi:putative ABC transport system ATP-binding protein
MIKVTNIGKKVLVADIELTILDALSLNVEAGESLAIVGPSGSGKSTLLGIMAGLDTPTNGTVHIDGQDITAMDEEGRAAVRARHVGFVFQSFHLLPALTALENVALPLELQKGGDAMGIAGSYLQRVGLADRTEHYPRQLSGGEQQRVALARALVMGPGIVLADEPTGNLDPQTALGVFDVMLSLNRQLGSSLVVVTHSLELAARFPRRLRLDGGRLVEG